MAESEPIPPTSVPPTDPSVERQQKDGNKLKYLDFVEVAALYVVVCFSTIYEFAKESSGPLKPGVQTVEGTVKTVIGPVYNKFHGLPFHLLKFVDRKVDECIIKVDSHVPGLIKQASSQALLAAQKAPEVARSLASQVQRAGVVDTATNMAKKVYAKYEPTAKECYTKYEAVAEQYAVYAWRWLNRLPLFPHAAHILVPTAVYWCDKYNQTVSCLAGEGYTMSYYMPLVPVERIVKVFKGAENGHANGESVVIG